LFSLATPDIPSISSSSFSSSPPPSPPRSNKHTRYKEKKEKEKRKKEIWQRRRAARVLSSSPSPFGHRDYSISVSSSSLSDTRSNSEYPFLSSNGKQKRRRGVHRSKNLLPSSTPGYSSSPRDLPSASLSFLGYDGTDSLGPLFKKYYFV
jgi:hypothetical protein